MNALKTRSDVFLELAKIRQNSQSPEELSELIEEYGAATDDVTASLAAALGEQYSLVTNGFLSDVLEVVSGERSVVTGEIAVGLPCPCCGYKTLDEIYDVDLGTGYDICLVCRWEDDGTKDQDTQSSVNRGSIREYRARMAADHNVYYREKFMR